MTVAGTQEGPRHLASSKQDVSETSTFRLVDSGGESRTFASREVVSETQSVFCVAARRDGAGVRQTDHRRAGRQKTGWTKPQRCPSMGIRSSAAGRAQAS